MSYHRSFPFSTNFFVLLDSVSTQSLLHFPFILQPCPQSPQTSFNPYSQPALPPFLTCTSSYNQLTRSPSLSSRSFLCFTSLPTRSFPFPQSGSPSASPHLFSHPKLFPHATTFTSYPQSPPPPTNTLRRLPIFPRFGTLQA